MDCSIKDMTDKLDKIISTFKELNTTEKMAKNENGDVAFVVESPNLEYFSKFVGAHDYKDRDTNDPEIWNILNKMWNESPELCIKNIFHKGDCRGGAKEKRLFLISMNWLLHTYPMFDNLCHVPEYRCWKDLVVLSSLNPQFRSNIVWLFVKQLL